MIKKLFLSILLISSSLFLLNTSIAAAFNPYSGVDCSTSGGSGSAICTDKSNTSNPISGSNGIIYKITIIVAFVAGTAAIVLIIISAIKFMTSGGDPQKVASAKGTLLNVIIGLVIISLASSIITYVVSKG
jgi:hypothetical protein